MPPNIAPRSADPMSRVDSGFDYTGGMPDDPPITPGSFPGGPADAQRIIKCATEVYNHEEMIRLPHRRIWDRVWERINGRYDFTKRARWQSQKPLPAVLIFALKALWEQTKSMEKAGDKWFEAETDEAEWQPLLDLPRDLVTQVLRSSGSDPTNNFLNVCYQASFWSVITGQNYIRITAEEDGFNDMTEAEDIGTIENVYQAGPNVDSALPSYGFGALNNNAATPYKLDDSDNQSPPQLPGQKGFRLRLEALNPRFVVVDTADRPKPRYVIHTQSLSRAEYRPEADARGWLHTDEVIRDSTSGAAGTPNSGYSPYSERWRATREKDLMTDPKRLDNITLMHFYGTLNDSLGYAVVEKPSYFIIANDKFLVWGPEPLPYWHGQIPITIGGDIKIPGAPYSKSLTEINIDIQEWRVDIFNMMIDALNQSINPPTEVDVDQLQIKPHQLASGLFPGKVLEVQKTGNPNPAITRSGIPDMSSGMAQMIGLMRPEAASFSGMDDVPANRPTRNRVSAEETRQKGATSGGIPEQIAKGRERDTLEVIAWQAYLVGLQKLPMDEWQAFIDRKINALVNRTRTIPPGAGQPDMNSEQRPGMPPNTGEQPSPRGKLPTGTSGSVSPMPGQPPPPQPQVAAPPGTPGAVQPPEYENPELVERYQQMRNWGPRERFTKLGSLFRFRVKVYTALESRREVLERLSQFVQMAEAMPALASRIKWHTVAEEACRALELDPETHLWPDAGSTADAIIAANKDSLAPRPVGLIAPAQPNAPPSPSGGY